MKLPVWKSDQKVMVTVPTYNERGNVEVLTARIFEVYPECHVVFIDDNSPDGTADAVRTLAEKDERVHLLLRKEQRGRGYSGVAGFQFALKSGADLIVEMDADLSHDPAYIPIMIEKMKDFDLILGSRFVSGGTDNHRSWMRQFLTICANAYIRTVLGIKVRDCNSGFRCYRREALIAVDLGSFLSEGPSIVQEMLFRCSREKIKILEIPIDFKNRFDGQTKLTYKQLFQGFMMVLKLRLTPYQSSRHRNKNLQDEKCPQLS